LINCLEQLLVDASEAIFIGDDFKMGIPFTLNKSYLE